MGKKLSFASLALLGLVLFSHSSASAKDVKWSLSRLEYFHPSRIENERDKEVWSLKPGDKLTIVYDDGSTFKEFKLGKFLGSGEGGRVFLLEGSDPVKVVKLALGGGKAYDLMQGEVDALRQLGRSNLPHATLYHFHTRIFVEKDYIEGETLDEMCKNWGFFSEEEKGVRLKELARFLEQYQASENLYGDLHAKNIMFDRNSKIWKVVDPGYVMLRTSPDLGRIYRFLGKRYRPIFDQLAAIEKTMSNPMGCRAYTFLGTGIRFRKWEPF
jgi:hypothetical protein